jgi:4-amino-4-deoxy-L-arabinose transferase-like glycosyltransferase
MSHSWETSSPAAPTASVAPVTTAAGVAADARTVLLTLAARVRLELLALLGLAGVLNLWALSRNGWANTYYSAAVRSMSSSWHDFLFASLDRGGVMTVDKPPLALWVQALSVRVFGFHSLSLLVPQALMGVASVALTYDLVRRRFGRAGGFVAGLALALTPITVAISRHNNPDALLVLCCVAALWCFARALEARRAGSQTRWLVAAGVCVGLAFETKMLVAMTVVPGMTLAWLWVDPAGRGRLRALGQLLWGGLALLVVGGAWPALVELTPAGDRPWISGTSNNTIWSLIFEYNGVGRVEGQAGGPGGVGGGTMFGGSPGPLRLLNSALGGQAGWLLGFALVGGLAILFSSRLRRGDARSGWLLAVGGAALTTAVLFSAASGILHPYYVSLLAPFVAALVGASAGELLAGRLHTRIVGPPVVAAGVAVELAVHGDYPENLGWLAPVLIAVGLLAAFALVAFSATRIRVAAIVAALAALAIAPSVWAFDTLGYATSSTFPSGGPQSLAGGGSGGGASLFGGGRGARGGFARGAGGGLTLFGPGGAGAGSGSRSGTGQGGSVGAPGAAPEAQGAPGAPPPGGAQVAPAGAGQLRGGFAGPGAGGGVGGGFGAGASSLKEVESYVREHGGGTVAVSSQSTAASAILEGDLNVAGIGGFSGRESDVSVSWLAQEVSAGKIRWVLAEQTAGGGGRGGLPGDTRTGARTALAAAEKACVAVKLPSSSSAGAVSGTGTLYDCAGRAAALGSVGAAESHS